MSISKKSVCDQEGRAVTVEERFERMESNLDMLIKIHLDNDREYRERFDQLMAAIEELKAASKQDGEHIHALVRIAEIHERRLSDLEGSPEG
jgi:hypothetical protein